MKNGERETQLRRQARALSGKLLRDLGFPPGLRGTVYLEDILAASAVDASLLSSVTKHLYAAVADRYGTTPAAVERSIRHAVGQAFGEERTPEAFGLFASCVRRGRPQPTNTEFIAFAAEKISRQLGETL